MRILVACVAASCWGVVHAAALPLASAPSLEQVVLARFDAWDLDGDDVLEAAEIDRLVVDPAHAGEDAAALAALKLALRSGRIEPAPLHRSLFETAPPPGTKPAAQAATSGATGGETTREERSVDEDRDAAASSRRKLDGPATVAALRSRYTRATKRIASAKRDVFLDETPDIDRLRQGSLGDCFLIAAVGAMAHRDPQSVRTMIRPYRDGHLVTLGEDHAVIVPPLTDSQLGLTSSTGDEGVWIAIIEQAYGSIRNERRPAEQQTLEPSDAIARGGSINSTIAALTGRVARTTPMRARIEKALEHGEAVDPIVEDIRRRLRDAFRDRRLVGAGTSSTDKGLKLPPGINGKHAYAVLAFDEEAGTVEIWNPHGNTFKPKGEPGIEHGYPTKAGRFTMPLVDFVSVFRAVTIETDAPALPRKVKAAAPKAATPQE